MSAEDSVDGFEGGMLHWSARLPAARKRRRESSAVVVVFEALALVVGRV